jgi:hypothetical protein
MHLWIGRCPSAAGFTRPGPARDILVMVRTMVGMLAAELSIPQSCISMKISMQNYRDGVLSAPRRRTTIRRQARARSGWFRPSGPGRE